jgi:hypothetical protein
MDLIKATTPTQRIVAASALIVLLVWGVIVLNSTKERETMRLTENNAVTEAATPLTDTSAPVETATFALG